MLVRKLKTTEQPTVYTKGVFYTLFDDEIRVDNFSLDAMTKLGLAMSKAVPNVSGGILSGYAYLGQLLAHDLSHLSHISQKERAEIISNDALYSPVSASLDLSCIYGAGDSKAFRDQGKATMRLGGAQLDNEKLLQGFDVPRDQNAMANIADERNDENLIVSQLHLQFLKLHNYFVELIAKMGPDLGIEALFLAAKKQVILHFQEIIINDFLYEILDRNVWIAIIKNKQSILWKPEPGDPAVLPIEFIGAAFKFGHPMVLSEYRLQKNKDVRQSTLFSMTGRGGFEGKGRHLPASLIIDWLLFFDFSRTVARNPRGSINIANPISPSVDITLKHIEHLPNKEIKNLAARNLLRSSQLGVASGQAIVAKITSKYARELQENNIQINPLSNDQLNLNNQYRQQDLLNKYCKELLENTPLWYYLLAEACADSEDNSGKLGPLASLIVAETIKGLLVLDGESILGSGKLAGSIRGSKNIAGPDEPEELVLQMSDLILAVNAGLPNPEKWSE